VQVTNDSAIVAGVVCRPVDAGCVSASNGTIIAYHAEEITFTLKDEAARQPAGKLLPVDVEVDLSRGDAYLYVAAWDVTTKRLGTLEIPYHADVPKTIQGLHASK
jgi:hypothetical protein